VVKPLIQQEIWNIIGENNTPVLEVLAPLSKRGLTFLFPWIEQTLLYSFNPRRQLFKSQLLGFHDLLVPVFFYKSVFAI